MTDRAEIRKSPEAKAAPDPKDESLNRGECIIPHKELSSVTLADIYKFADDLEKTNPGAARCLDRALHDLVKRSIGVICEAEADPEYDYWYRKGERHPEMVDAPERAFDAQDCYNIHREMKKSSEGQIEQGRAPVDLIVCLHDPRGLPNMFLQGHALNSKHLPLIIDALECDVVAAMPIRVDLEKGIAAEEMLSVIPSQQNTGIEQMMKAQLVAKYRPLGVTLFPVVYRDPFAMSPQERIEREDRTGISMESTVQQEKESGVRFLDILCFQEGNDNYSPRNLLPGFIVIPGQSTEMTKAEAAAMLHWMALNVNSIREPEKDPGLALTLKLLPEVVYSKEAGEPGTFSEAIVESGAYQNERKRGKAAEGQPRRCSDRLAAYMVYRYMEGEGTWPSEFPVPERPSSARRFGL